MRSHESCFDCGSSDALTEYDDGHTFCHSCNTYHKENKTLTSQYVRKDKTLADLPGDFSALTERGISLETARKYKVGRPKDSFYAWQFPLFKDGIHVANKYRLSGERKGFSVDGDFNASELFGQVLFEPGSAKQITVTEGYEDAMAAFEMQGSQYPVVSVHSASTARKDCANSFEYLNSFDNIVLCFDADDAKIGPDGVKHHPGQDAAIQVAQLFPAKKVRILTLQKAKDANDYLKMGLRREFMDEWWKAPVYTPAGLRLGTDLWEEIKASSNVETVNYPWSGFNEMTYGIRLGELVIITADTGIGKTSVLKEIEYYLLNHTSYSIGIMHLVELLPFIS